MNFENKIIPDQIKKEALEALSYYPELSDVAIIFKFKHRIRKSTMLAQPTIGSLFKSKKTRKYQILISRKIQIDGNAFTVEDIPSDVLVGWLGHELGHVMDYTERNAFDLLIFGLKYLFSAKHMQEIELTADTIAIQHGMGSHILKTKNFILDHADLSEKYKTKIRRLYISPEEVIQLINDGDVAEELAER